MPFLIPSPPPAIIVIMDDARSVIADYRRAGPNPMRRVTGKVAPLKPSPPNTRLPQDTLFDPYANTEGDGDSGGLIV
jgi:hypothetical protein